MIISKAQVQNIMKIYGKDSSSNRLDNIKSTGTASKTDELNISSASRIMQKAMIAAKQAPDIRWEKVNELKEKMASDTLEVSDEDIADKILEQALTDDLL